MTPDETAKKVLEGELAPSSMKFSEFRWKMIEASPEYISDDDIHDLYLKHVAKRAQLTNRKGETYSVPTELLGVEFTPRGVACNDCHLLMSEGPRFDCRNPKHVPDTRAVDQVVEWADRQRPSEAEVRRVAAKKDPTLARKVSKSQRKRNKKKRLRDRTLGEIASDVRRASKKIGF